MAIDRMDFAGQRIYVAGATTTPQPAPYSPGLRGFATGGRFGWEAKGGWQFDGTEAISSPEGRSELTCSTSGDSFLCEFYIRCSQASDNDPIAGLSINSDFHLLFDPKNSRMTIIRPHEPREIAFPTGFSLDHDQHIRLEVNGLTVSVVIGNNGLRCDATLAGAGRYLTLFTENSLAVFSAFELTEGFEELFQKNGLLCEEDGWQLIGSATSFQVSGGELTISTGAGEPAIASRAARSGNVEAAANIRLLRPLSTDAEFALVLLDSANEVKMKLGIATIEERFVAFASVEHEPCVFSSVVDAAEYHQFRIETIASFARVYLDGEHLGDVPAPAGAERIGVLCAQADIAVEMLRFTAI
jgi:hypothetical protein